MNRDFSQSVLPFGSGVDAVAFQRAFAPGDALNGFDNGVHGAIARGAVFKFLAFLEQSHRSRGTRVAARHELQEVQFP